MNLQTNRKITDTLYWYKFRSEQMLGQHKNFELFSRRTKLTFFSKASVKLKVANNIIKIED